MAESWRCIPARLGSACAVPWCSPRSGSATGAIAAAGGSSADHVVHGPRSAAPGAGTGQHRRCLRILPARPSISARRRQGKAMRHRWWHDAIDRPVLFARRRQMPRPRRVIVRAISVCSSIVRVQSLPCAEAIDEDRRPRARWRRAPRAGRDPPAECPAPHGSADEQGASRSRSRCNRQGSTE